MQKETRFLYELERVFTHPIVVKNRLLRNIKLCLYDSGMIVNAVTVCRANRNGLAVAFYGTLALMWHYLASIIVTQLMIKLINVSVYLQINWSWNFNWPPSDENGDRRRQRRIAN